MPSKSPYYIKEDYPLEVLNKRKELLVQLQEERKAGNRAFLKYDKLIVLPKKSIENTHTNTSSKRTLSQSPEIHTLKHPDMVNNKKQPIKKSKTTLNQYVIQKPKLALNAEKTLHDSSLSTEKNSTA